MPTKKQPKPNSTIKHKWKSHKKAYSKSTGKQPLLDTSRIPWFSSEVQTTRKTGTDD